MMETFISEYILSHLNICISNNLPLTETRVSSVESTWNRKNKFHCWCRCCLCVANENVMSVKSENPMWKFVHPNLKPFWKRITKCQKTYCLELSPKAASNFLRALFKSSQPDIVPITQVIRKKGRIILSRYRSIPKFEHHNTITRLSWCLLALDSVLPTLIILYSLRMFFFYFFLLICNNTLSTETI